MELNQNIVYSLNAKDWWENISIYWHGSYTIIEYDRDIIFQRLQKKFVRVLNIDKAQIHEESNLVKDLLLQGSEVVFLVGVLECEYDLKSNNRLACQIKTVGDLLNYCKQTWPSEDVNVWFPNPLLSEVEPKTPFRQMLKTINHLQPIHTFTTFFRTFLQRSPNPLRKYILQGRRRWLKLNKMDIHPNNEAFNEKLINLDLWTEQDWIDWYGAKWKVYKEGYEGYNEKIKI